MLFGIWAGCMFLLPPLWLFAVSLGIINICIGLVYGNVMAIAMLPLGRMAGMGASVIGMISAFLAAGSKLGAPLGHDFCCISLSDLMTPWNIIEQRIKAAAMGDFVTSLYNPKSKKRHWQLGRLQKIFLTERL